MSNITTYRGDTRPIVRNVTVGGVATNITGWSFILTINEEESPADTTNQIAQSIGIVTDGAAGEVSFPQSFEMSATVGRFFYDIETTDADGKTATRKGEFNVLQDNTKGNPGQTWVPTETVIGTAIPVDGSEYWQAIYSNGPPPAGQTYTYQERDGVPVMRVEDSLLGGGALFFPFGAESERSSFGHTGVFDFTFYVYLPTDAAYGMAIQAMVPVPAFYLEISHVNEWSDIYADVWDETGTEIDDYQDHGLTPWNWIRSRVRIDFDNKVISMRTWVATETEPGTWDMQTVVSFPFFGAGAITLWTSDGATAGVDVASFGWERLS